MNLAFSAVVISLLAVPGFLFWHGYFFEEQVQARTEWDTSVGQLLKGLVTSVVLHIPWYFAAYWVSRPFGLTPSLRGTIALMAGAYGDAPGYLQLFEEGITSVTTRPFVVFLYFGLLYIASFFAGTGLRKFIVSRDWEKSLVMLRYSEWYYLLDANVAKIEPPPGYTRLAVYIGATVCHGKQTYVYRGVMSDYDLDASGELKQIRLEWASRRLMAKDRDPPPKNPPDPQPDYDPRDPRYYGLKASCLILQAIKVKTLSVSYVAMKKDRTKAMTMIRLPIK